MITKTFEVYYRHPEGHFKLVKELTFSATCGDPLFENVCIDLWLEEVYRRMQGDCWSPNNEACGLIEELGVEHTSMSVGDIVRVMDTGEVWRVERSGWSLCKGAPCES
jgi:hypothetical protein